MCNTLPPPILLAIMFAERHSYSRRDTQIHTSNPKKKHEKKKKKKKEICFQGPRISEQTHVTSTELQAKCGVKLDQPSSTQWHNHGWEDERPRG